jgi:DNA-directed RNA polymerase subunit RPC12/RpoP
VAIHRGNYLHAPFWDFRHKRRVPMHTTLTLTLTPEQIKGMSTDEVNAALRKAFAYDDYRYQKENGIRITEKFRAQGMHKILYQCPHCMSEAGMASEGADIFCRDCGKRWTLSEDGTLKANEGETEFSHVPDWFEWEREQVKTQIERGEYHFEDEVDVHSLPRCWKFEPLGKATLTHDPENGFILTGHYRGKDYRIQREPLQINSLHVEYDFPHIKPFDCVDISTENDSFYCFPTKENVVTKLAFATEIIYQRKEQEAKEKRAAKG